MPRRVSLLRTEWTHGPTNVAFASPWGQKQSITSCWKYVLLLSRAGNNKWRIPSLNHEKFGNFCWSQSSRVVGEVRKILAYGICMNLVVWIGGLGN